MCVKSFSRLPGTAKAGRKAKPSGTLAVENGQVINKLHPKELKQLLGKSAYPCYLDFSPLYFQLEDDDFLLSCPNIVKEYREGGINQKDRFFLERIGGVDKPGTLVQTEAAVRGQQPAM